MNSDLTRANELYKKSQQTSGVSRVLKRSYLEKAISLYRKEMSKVTRENAPSLYRNIGFASYRLAVILDPKFDLSLIVYYFTEAIKALLTAWVMKPKERNNEWGGQLEELVSDCFEKSYRIINGDVTKLFMVDALSKAIGPEKEFDLFRIRSRLANGQYFYRCGVKIMEGRDYQATLRFVEYARQEYELAAKCAHNFEYKDFFQVDISLLNDDISFLKRSCDSINLRDQADILFDTSVMQSEELDFEKVWDILDMYKAAEMHSRNIDIENEAVAVSRQGRIFYKILKLQPKAHTYYRASFDLAATLYPRDMTNCDWFKECKIVLEELQQAKVKEEEAQREKERAPYLGKMKAVLDALKAHSDDSFKLLKYIYKTHPPKVSFDYNEKNVDATNIKKTVMKAIIHYHPDKQVKYDMEWRILTEEITKYLNVRYETLK